MPVKDFDYHSSLRFQNEYKAEFQPPPLVPVKDVDFQSSLRYQTEVRAEPVNKEKIADNGKKENFSLNNYQIICDSSVLEKFVKRLSVIREINVKLNYDI